MSTLTHLNYKCFNSLVQFFITCCPYKFLQHVFLKDEYSNILSCNSGISGYKYLLNNHNQYLDQYLDQYLVNSPCFKNG